MEFKEESKAKTFGGWTKRFSHYSETLSCKMFFSAFFPSSYETNKTPVLYFLSGLTCTDENFITKAGAQSSAEIHSLLLIAPDTSPRGTQIEGQADSWDFGLGAGFYVNATEEKWAKHFRMYDYVTKELPALVASQFVNADTTRQSVFGHSMGGHGALIVAFKNRDSYRSVSAFAPICNPVNAAWGVKAFSGYLGVEHKEGWKEYDATELLLAGKVEGVSELKLLVDQGTADKFYFESKQLQPEALQAALQKNGLLLDNNNNNVRVRLQQDYDHSYYFISTFVEEHIAFHASHLKA